MESWLTILLGLALLLFQGYSEKKKKEAAKTKKNIISNEPFSNGPFFFTSEPEPEHEPEQEPVRDVYEDILDTPRSADFKPVDVVIPEQDNISSGEIKDVEETTEKPFIVDPRQLVIFSEIMKPKYQEQ
ncbi:MAG: hypothetical protein PHT25_00970 [Bacteroidales bacterium]|nr:hypothetical protein [Bacteroidales bacterium]